MKIPYKELRAGCTATELTPPTKAPLTTGPITARSVGIASEVVTALFSSDYRERHRMNITVNISEADSLFFEVPEMVVFFLVVFFTPKTPKDNSVVLGAQLKISGDLNGVTFFSNSVSQLWASSETGNSYVHL